MNNENYEKQMNSQMENKENEIKEISKEETLEVNNIVSDISRGDINADTPKPSDTIIINILALAFGIASVLSLLFGFQGLICFPTSIIAIILGSIGRKYPGKGMGRAGKICGIVSLIVLLFIFGVGIWILSSFFSGLIHSKG